jgi:hypothetical protein
VVGWPGPHHVSLQISRSARDTPCHLRVTMTSRTFPFRSHPRSQSRRGERPRDGVAGAPRSSQAAVSGARAETLASRATEQCSRSRKHRSLPSIRPHGGDRHQRIACARTRPADVAEPAGAVRPSDGSRIALYVSRHARVVAGVGVEPGLATARRARRRPLPDHARGAAALVQPGARAARRRRALPARDRTRGDG